MYTNTDSSILEVIRVDKNSAEPLYLQIQKILQDQIRSGNLPPGMQIPSEIELAEQYQVSRMTARKSIDGLVAKGLLFRQPGKGTFVAEDTLSYGFSTMLSFSQTLSKRGYKVTTEIMRQEIITGPPYVCEQLHLDPCIEIIIIRRLRFVNDKPMAIHETYLDSRAYRDVLKYDLSKESVLEVIEHSAGFPMAYTNDTIRAVNADGEVSRLLDLPERGAIIEVEGVSYDDKGKPIRFSRAIYRGDAIKLAVRNTHEQASIFAIIEDE